MFKLKRYLQDDAATTVEYAIMLALIMVVCMTAIGFFGSNAGGSLQYSSDRIDKAVNGAAS
jgi:Flp pilus assembly pilin Flp